MTVEAYGMLRKKKEGKLRTCVLCDKRREAARQLVSFDVATIMNQSEVVDDWPGDDASETQISDLSSSDSEVSQPSASAPRSRLRPAGGALTFVPFADWKQERSYEGEPTIRYNMEWKLFAKNRSQAGETELNIVISPRKFWKYVLQSKLIDACADNPWKEDKTKLVLSVTDRKTSKIIKEFPKLNIKWSFVAKQLREWSPFLTDGKKITITVTFYYRAVSPGKPERGSATANQQADLEARTTGVGRGACIRKAYLFERHKPSTRSRQGSGAN